MITFLWSDRSVKDKVKAINDKDMKKKARKAYKFLKNKDDSAYKKFHDYHKRFLQKHAGEELTERQRRRPLHFIEQVGVECAVWPHLYWTEAMCESTERFTDVRRVERRGRRAKPSRTVAKPDEDAGTEDEAIGGSDDSSSDDSDEDDAAAQRHSIKRSFMAKCLSPLLGYASTFELVQFVYDLTLWTALGAKKNLNVG
eukprot:14753393-Alexandrium_andersonii.AAC.1